MGVFPPHQRLLKEVNLYCFCGRDEGGLKKIKLIYVSMVVSWCGKYRIFIALDNLKSFGNCSIDVSLMWCFQEAWAITGVAVN